MPKRDANHMEAQRVRILRATFECIAESGVRGTSIAGICQRAELSAGALYVHFRNRDDIIAETIRYGSASPIETVADWPSLKAAITSFVDLRGFDIVTVVRARLHLNAEIVRSGQLQDIARPILRRSVAGLADNLQQLQERCLIRLILTPERTAINMSAFIDGMLWVGLTLDRPLPALEREMRDGLDSFVEIMAHDAANVCPQTIESGSHVRTAVGTTSDTNCRNTTSHDERSGLPRRSRATSRP